MSRQDLSSISNLEDATDELNKGADQAPQTEEQQQQQPQQQSRRFSKDDAAGATFQDGKLPKDAAGETQAPLYSNATYPATNSPTLGCVHMQN